MDLIRKIKCLPKEPGVYIIKDNLGNIIYIGKSKSLKNRVNSYFNNNKNHSPKIIEMVGRISDIDYIITDTELEALLLECKLIKEKKPIYNRLMKNDKKYQYIKVTINEKYPRIVRVSEKNDDSIYFGPFSSRNIIDEAILVLKKYFKLRICDNINIKHSENGCLQYQIGNCVGVCIESFDTSKYNILIDDIIRFLQNKDDTIINNIEHKMKECVRKLDFENAQKYKNEIDSLKYIINTQNVIKMTMKRKNLIAIEFLNNNSIKIFFINGNKVIYKDNIDLKLYNNKSLTNYIKFNIYNKFIYRNTIKELDKEDIDEAMIIYSYLKNNTEKLVYFKIAKKYMKNKEEDELNRFLQKYIEKIIKK